MKKSRLVAAAVVLAAIAVAAYAWLRLARPGPPNILLITLDTTRADRIGAYGYAGARTPVLDALAARGVRFSRAAASAPLTGPSHATILTGLYPPQHGVRDNVVFPLAASHRSLATMLRGAGYETAAFVAAFPVASAFGFSAGFDKFDESFHESADDSQAAERPGNEVADAAIAWLTGRTSRAPFFVWTHFYDAHTPYTPPAPFAAEFKGREYDGEIAFADQQVGRVLDTLAKAGLADNTVVVVVADHGESLGEHGESTHAILIYEATIHVPLIIAGPAVPHGETVSSRVGTADIVPTVLRLAGLPVPDELPGRDLRAAFGNGRLQSQPIYSESIFGRLNCRWSALRAWSEGDYKLIRGSSVELFDIANDPGEAKDLAASEPQRAKQMGDALAAALARMAPSGDSARTVTVSPEQEEKLRSLGYIGGGSGGAGALDEPGLPDPRTHVQLYERIQQLAKASRGPQAQLAVGQLVTLAEQDPGNPYAHFAVGNAAYRVGLLALGATAYDKGLALDPDRPGVRLPYGHLLRDMGRLDESEQQLRIAVEQTTDDDDRTRIALARTLIAQKKLAEAGTIIDAVFARAPNHREAAAARGEWLVASGRDAEAIAFLEKGAAGSDDPILEIARLHLQAGDNAAAITTAERVLARSPAHPWALALKAHALIASGQRAAGVALLEKALLARPRRPEAWNALAAAFTAANDPKRATMCRAEAARAGAL